MGKYAINYDKPAISDREIEAMKDYSFLSSQPKREINPIVKWFFIGAVATLVGIVTYTETTKVLFKL